MKGPVYLALSRQRLLEWVAEKEGLPSPLWVCADVLTDEELSQYRAAGIELTNFFHVVDALDAGEVAEAKATISEHHPDLSIVLI